MNNSETLKDLQFMPLGAEHLDAVVKLEYLIFSTPWSKEQYAAMMDKGICKIFGVLSNGNLLGYIAVSMLKTTGELEIYNVAVLPEARQQGLAKKLLKLVLATARTLGLERAVLEVREGNVAAIGLYESTGFTRCGMRKAYYSEPVENALLYEYIF